MGLNEFSGYFAVAGSALATGWLASHYGLRPQPFYLGVAYVLFGLAFSVLAVRETRHYVAQEVLTHHAGQEVALPSQGEIFRRASLTDKNLSSISQAGLVNNLNDGMAWGLFPLVFAAAGMSLAQIGTLAAIYPAVWGMAQIFTGALSDRIGRKQLIVWGMWVQAVGVYRLWRDLGYAVGALLAGITADLFGLAAAVWLVAAITLLSGVIAAVRMNETLAAEKA